MRAALLPCLLAAALGGALHAAPRGGVDHVVAEARSPDGRIVARLWCPALCDVSDTSVLTLSPPGRRAGIVRGRYGAVIGRMPERDVVLTFGESIEIDGQPVATSPALAWRGSSELIVSATCPGDDARKPLRRAQAGAIAVTFVDRANGRGCRHRG